MENSIFPLLNVFCHQTPWQRLLPPAFHNPLVLPPNALHSQSSPSLSPPSAYEEVGAPLRCQAASSVPGFLHIHIILSYFPPHISPCLGEAQSILKATSLVSLFFFLKSLFGWGAYQKCDDILVSQDVTSSSHTNQMGLLFLCATRKWDHSLNLWDNKCLYISLSHKIVNKKSEKLKTQTLN